MAKDGEFRPSGFLSTGVQRLEVVGLLLCLAGRPDYR
jgi:hypothetical protein